MGEDRPRRLQHHPPLKTHELSYRQTLWGPAHSLGLLVDTCCRRLPTHFSLAAA